MKMMNFKEYLKKLFYIEEYREYRHEEFAYYGESVFIGKFVKINHPERVYLGDHATIHRGTVINALGGLYMGAYSGISYNCLIYTVDHKVHGARSIPFDNTALLKPVIIEDFAVVSSRVSIAPGVKIGTGAIVGIGSVVIKDVPPFAIVIGNPAEVIAYRDKEEFERLKEQQKFQPHRIDHYEQKIPVMYQAKFKKYIPLLNLPLK